MIEGAQLWDSAFVGDMVTTTIAGATYLTYPDLVQSPYHALAASAARTPNAIAIVDEWDRATSYDELLTHVDALAAYLAQAKEITVGSHVGLLSHADLEFVVALYAISKLGAVCIPLPTKYRMPELVSLMYAADLDLLIAGEEFKGWADAFPVTNGSVVWISGTEQGYGLSHIGTAPHGLTPAGTLDTTAIMMFTSGTTSTAKGVLLSNANVCHAAETYARLMSTTPADKCLIPVPIYHVTGLIACLMQFVLVGATTYLHRRFDAHRVCETIFTKDITYLHASPTVFAEIIREKENYPFLPSMRSFLSGSSYEPVARMRAYHEWLPNAEFRVVYGLTETASPALLFPYDTPTSEKAGATGVPVPGIEAKIASEDGEELDLGEVGELWLKGTCVTRGYYQRKTDDITADGWLKTGDVAYADADGFVWVCDRKKDMINRGGEKVWCSALEEVLLELEGVLASCVAGIPDELYGEVPVAAVVAAPGAELSEASIKEKLATRVAHFKIPTHIVFVNELPKTRGEKPDRSAVQALVLANLKGKE